MSKIYRKIALERLSSPEQLDRLITVTPPSGWLALMGMALLLAFTFVWALYGRIPTMVSGGGILIKTGGVVSVVAPVQGQIDSIYVREGESVRKGQIVARLAQPALLDEIRGTRQQLEEEKARLIILSEVGDEKYRLGMASTAKERDNLRQVLATSKERAHWLQSKIESQQNLLEEGLVTRQTLVESRNKPVDLELTQAETLNQFKKLDAHEQELAAERDGQLEASRKLVNQVRRDLELQEARLAFSSRVVSNHTGLVVELRTSQGQVINPGDLLLVLEQTGDAIQDLEALIYMSPDQGEQIKSGMIVRITPQTVKREEFGYMLGMVTKVADFPSSQQGMMRQLKNQVLVDQFSENGAPIAVFADLIPDPVTVSGYKWSSPKGPPLEIFSGTLCSGTIEVRSQAPLSLMIPYLKKQVGVD